MLSRRSSQACDPALLRTESSGAAIAQDIYPHVTGQLQFQSVAEVWTFVQGPCRASAQKTGRSSSSDF